MRHFLEFVLETVTINGKVIRYIWQKDTNYNWEEARNACKKIGLVLPVPKNKAENDFFSTLTSESEYGGVFFGIRNEDGIWTNVNTGTNKIFPKNILCFQK